MTILLTDPARLDALQRTGLLDGRGDDALDAFAEMAARLLDAPVALVTLVCPDRQLFVSAAGLEGIDGTPLSHSICQHVVTGDAPLAVSDARRHPAFSTNGSVTELGVVAYAGTPVRSPEGLPLGALCVLDRAPHAWTEADMATLGGLAAAAGSVIATRVLRADGAAAERQRDEARGLLDAVVGSALDCVIAVDGGERILAFNPAAERTFGIAADRVLGCPLRELIAVEGGAPATGVASATGAEPEEAEGIRSDGTRFPLELTVAPAQRGVAGTFTVHARDLTEQRRARRALARTEQRLKAAVGAAPMVLFVLDADGRFTLSEGKGLETLGLAPGEVVGSSVFDVYASAPAFVACCRRALAGESFDAIVEIGPLVFDTCFHAQRGEGGHAEAVIGVATDITARRRGEEQLAHLAYHDQVTGLPNRRALEERLGAVLAGARRDGTTAALLCLELTDLKLVSDGLGHDACDAVLREVAERLRAWAAPGELVARHRGDEFALVLGSLGACPTGQATRRASELLELVGAPIVVDDVELDLRPSVGVALYPSHAEYPAELLTRADAATRQARRRGGRAHALYDPGRDDSRRRLALAGALRRALAEDELLLHFQPLFDLSTSAPTGVEALVRWHDPARGLVPPGEFIPFAEESGLIEDVGAWVLRSALRQAAAWARIGLQPQIAVNVAPRQLQRSGFPADVAALLAEHGVPPARLTVEVTESAAMADLPRTERALGALNALGVRLAIDDFGTAHSSLSRLHALPVDVLKIDRSFLRGVPHDRHATSIVATIASLARSLDIATVAEGVEEREQVAFLRAQGCTTGQGFLFARPAPAEDVTALLLGALPPQARAA